MTYTATDLFCGAGGSSQGAEAAGVELRMAANHWQLAIDTHASNFPTADHDCADVSQVDPRRYPSTDILLASPECTHHTQARSNKHQPDLFNPDGDPAAERSRATMWDVCRFAEAMALRGHPYKLVLVENVIEILRWPPFHAWLAAMESLHYRHRIVSLNSMVAHGASPAAPQSRDRVYVVFWRDGVPTPDLDLRPPAWCPPCDDVVEAVQSWKRPEKRWGRYRQQYTYRCPTCGGEAYPLVHPAATAIDWTIPAPRIGDRDRPLAKATRRRIEVGLRRFVGPVVAQAAGNTFERPGYVRAWSTDRPMPTQMATLQHGLAVPPDLVVDTAFGGDRKVGVTPTSGPWPTQTGRQSMALVLLPFIAELRGGGSDARPVTDPLATVTANGNHHGLVTPPGFYVKNYGDGDDPSMVKPLTWPLGAVTTQDHHALLTVPFLTSYYRTANPSGVDEPVPTVTTRDRHALVEPTSLDVDDCGFRMLEPHEVGRAMAFPDAYVVLGTKRDKVRQYGNAVTPPAMRLLLERCLRALDR